MSTSLIGGGRRNAWAAIDASEDDFELVAGVTGQKIRVTSFIINHGDTTASSVTFLSDDGDTATAISPPFKTTANGGFIASSENERGWFETIAGEALAVDTGAGSTTSVLVNYILV